jgi:hypothetical protein
VLAQALGQQLVFDPAIERASLIRRLSGPSRSVSRSSIGSRRQTISSRHTSSSAARCCPTRTARRRAFGSSRMARCS